MTTPSVTASGNAKESISEAFNCSGGNLLILFTTRGATPSYAGVTMTLLGTYGADDYQTSVWYIIDPASGSNTISMGGTSPLDVSLWVALDNVNTDDFLTGTVASTSGSSLSMNGTLDGSLTLLWGDNHRSGTPAPDPSVSITTVDSLITQQSDDSNSNNQKLLAKLYSDVNPGGGNETYTFTAGGSKAVAVGVEVLGVSSGAGTQQVMVFS